MTEKTVKPRRWWKTLLKSILLAVMAVVLFIFGILVYTVNVLRPERLTPIVEHLASSSLNADVSLSRATLKLKDHWPFLFLQLDSLAVVSRDMLSLPDSLRATLPAGADTLLAVDRISGGVNLLAIAKGTIELKQVYITSPAVNIVDVAPGISNYNIALPSETAEPDTAAFAIPDIRFDSFRILSPKPVRYCNIPDSIDASIDISTLGVEGSGAPRYSFALHGNLASPLLRAFMTDSITFGFDGALQWSREQPARLAVEGFTVRVAMIESVIDAVMEFAPEPAIESLTLKVAPVAVSEVLAMVPADMRRSMMLDPLRTDARIAIDATLTKPYRLSSGELPSADVSLSVPRCSFSYGRLKIGEFFTDIDISNVDNNPDNATVDIRRFYIKGRNGGLDLSVSGSLSRLISDPLFDGKVKGNVHLAMLPSALTERLGAVIGGNIVIDSDIRMRPSYLTRSSFHKLYLKGSVDATGLLLARPDSSAYCYADHAVIEFGTNRRFVRDTVRVPDLLMASLTVDSAFVRQPDFTLSLNGLRAGVGCVNTGRSPDTTAINPVGASFSLASLRMNLPADTASVRLRDISAKASVRPYRHIDSLPEFAVALSAGRISAGNRTNRLMLSRADISLDAHLNPARPRVSKRFRMMADSLRKLHPSMSADSIYAIARASRPGRHAADSFDHTREWLDLSVSGPMAKFLRNWSLHGDIKAARASLFTPVFPLRNRISDFRMNFTSDSLRLDGLAYRAGRSDLKVSGQVTDIRRAILSRRHTPLKMRLSIDADTIDINQLAAAFFAGAAYSLRRDSIDISLSDADDDEALQQSIDRMHQSADSTGPLLIPMNVDAMIGVSARNVIYSDLLLHNMTGRVQMMGGALNLDNLSAASDAGSISLSALYSAPDTSDMSFGFGMQTKGFNIEKFLQLVPAVDSILPLLGDMGGIINADMAATCDITPQMDIEIPSLKAALKIRGDSLTLLDPETFKTVSKWLFFKNKNRNLIDSMSVEILVENSQLQVFPFSFNFDRYKLGVLGHNDFNMNYNYHVAVLKSPIPFKFGVNISGTPDKMKVRLGGSKFKKGMDIRPVSVVDTTRVSLIRQIGNIFRRGASKARLRPLQISTRPDAAALGAADADTLSAADSLRFINEGMIEAPQPPAVQGKNRKKRK